MSTTMLRLPTRYVSALVDGLVTRAVDVVRTGGRRVDDPVPATSRHGREVEVEVLPVHVHHHVDVHVRRAGLAGHVERESAEREGEHPRLRIVPAGTEQAAAVPRDVGQPALVDLAGEERGAPDRRLRLAEGDQLAGEPDEVRVLLGAGPVEPGDLVVLAVGVVVAVLGAAGFVAHDHHRHALRQQQERQEVSDLAGAQRLDRRVVGVAFDAVVPAVVVVVAVAVVFAVGLVVLAVVAHQVVEREAVVGGDEVDAVDRQLAVRLVEVGAAGDPGGDRADQAHVALPKRRMSSR